MLYKLRQKSLLMTRFIAGVLVCAWVFMALAPCSMATLVDKSMQHEAMADCNYCPEHRDNTMPPCEFAHKNLKHLKGTGVDTLDVDTFVLLETFQRVEPFKISLGRTEADISPTRIHYLHPLQITGTLLI